MSPPLIPFADERLRCKLRDLKMPTPFGRYMGVEGVSEWQADFPPAVRVGTNCAWASMGDCKVSTPNTSIIPGIEQWQIKPSRDPSLNGPPKQTLLNPSTRMVTYD